jgi:hypothetical protein
MALGQRSALSWGEAGPVLVNEAVKAEMKIRLVARTCRGPFRNFHTIQNLDGGINLGHVAQVGEIGCATAHRWQ